MTYNGHLSDLTLPARLLYFVLHSLKDHKTNQSFYSIGKLCSISGLSERAIQNSLLELEKAKIIKREMRKGKSTLITVLTRINLNKKGAHNMHPIGAPNAPISVPLSIARCDDDKYTNNPEYRSLLRKAYDKWQYKMLDR